MCCDSFTDMLTSCGVLTSLHFLFSTGLHGKSNNSFTGNNIQNKKVTVTEENAESCRKSSKKTRRALSPFSAVSQRLPADTNRGAAVIHVAKACSLANALIKPLTIIPTKPDLKAIQRRVEECELHLAPPPPSSVSSDVCT